MQEIRIGILHCLNEISLRNQWRDSDRFSIRLARQMVSSGLPENEAQFLRQIQGIRTHFFQINRVSKKYYSEYAWSYIAKIIDSAIMPPTCQEGITITSEERLFQVVTEVLSEYKEEIESTRLWQPFWNEENQKPCTPKAELSLQPTIFSQLRRRFRQRGIEFLREANDGAGPLDFRCTTTSNNSILNCCIEFKRAQHPQLEQKIQRQLPAYMDAAGTEYGVFFVFWFKDGIAYKNPTKYSNPQVLRLALVDAAKSVAPRIIEVTIVDVTPKPSASRK